MAAQFLSIGEVVKLVGKSATTIRKLEARGIVTPARLQGQDRRLYSVDDVATIRQAIDAARATGPLVRQAA